MKWRVPGQEVDQIKFGEIVEKDCQVRGFYRENTMDHSRWMKQIRDD